MSSDRSGQSARLTARPGRASAATVPGRHDMGCAGHAFSMARRQILLLLSQIHPLGNPTGRLRTARRCGTQWLPMRQQFVSTAGTCATWTIGQRRRTPRANTDRPPLSSQHLGRLRPPPFTAAGLTSRQPTSSDETRTQPGLCKSWELEVPSSSVSDPTPLRPNPTARRNWWSFPRLVGDE